jgi:hypothetical protein
VIVRSQSPCLTAEQFAEINISGWQQQRSDGEICESAANKFAIRALLLPAADIYLSKLFRS